MDTRHPRLTITTQWTQTMLNRCAAGVQKQASERLNPVSSPFFQQTVAQCSASVTGTPCGVCGLDPLNRYHQI